MNNKILSATIGKGMDLTVKLSVLNEFRKKEISQMNLFSISVPIGKPRKTKFLYTGKLPLCPTNVGQRACRETRTPEVGSFPHPQLQEEIFRGYKQINVIEYDISILSHNNR